MLELLKVELEKIQAEKTQILASPVMAQLNALSGAEMMLQKLIKQGESENEGTDTN